MNDFFARASAAYLSEAFISLVLAIILAYYYRIYKRQFLHLWALSWTAGVMNLLTLSIIIVNLNASGYERHIFSFVATFCQSAQLVLLLLGSTAIVFKKVFARREIVGWVIVLFIMSLGVTLPYVSDPNGETERYAIRVGFRYASVLLSFVAAGMIISRQHQFIGAIGRKLIAFSFITFGLYQVYYVLIVIGNVIGNPIPVPVFFGIIEIVLMALIGLSMVIYLLEDEHRRLTDTHEELANFLYRTSHDLRSPIATMQSVLMMARNYPTTITSDQTIEMIENRVRKLDQVITDISDMTVKTSGEIRYQVIRFDSLMNDLIEQAKHMQGGAEINFECTTDAINTFMSDQQYIRTILTALIENSIKYRDVNKEPCRIIITLHRKSNRIILDVWDNGKGIREEILPHVFNMFYRGNTDIEGTGLGLYLARSLVKKLEGKIEATSVYGRYSKFTVVLPA